ncbi:flocculation protein FLO11-like [Mizuhopecten yessoensis]|uniref:C2H2-type domain-containing protein n=1 Tax=Mizuhopecten yessoensis TaxID=6573 RepID=A0A210Q1R3_MIZYE|nr:flocculation protein FLO11-like [Mizuhopecten yessoensis]OWF42684.1 hypothetical protein KP79_PYT15763 [Mizuhopecten yessoensis]
MDSYDPNCGLEMDCEEKNDEVFQTFLCRGNKGVEVTDQGDMYIVKSTTDLSDFEDIAEGDAELKNTFECPEEDISEEDAKSSDEEDDRNDKDWTGSDAASSSDGSSSSSSEDYTDEEMGSEFKDLTEKVKVNRKKKVGGETNFSVFSKKKKGRRKTDVPVSGRKGNDSSKITVLRIGLDNQVLSQTIITDEKSVQMALKSLKDCNKKVKAPVMALKKTKLNVQHGKQESTLKTIPGRIIKVIKVVGPKGATIIGQALNARGDCSLKKSNNTALNARGDCSLKKSNNTDSVLWKEKANQMSADLIHVRKEEVTEMLVDSAESRKDWINSTEVTQTVSTLNNSSSISKAVEKGDISSNITVFPGTIWKGDFTSSLGALSVGQENISNVTIKQEPNNDFEPCNYTPILKDSKDELKPRYSHVTFTQEPKDDLELDSNMAVLQEPEYNNEPCSYLAIMNDHNYTCKSDVDVPCIKQEPHDDVHELMRTSTAVTQTILEGDSSCGRFVGSSSETEYISSLSVPSQPTHLHLKRKQSAETNKCLEKKVSKSMKLDQSASSQSTVKPLSFQPLSSQLIIKLPSLKSALKFTPSHSVKQSTSSQSTAKSTSSQSTVKSTSSQSTVKPLSSQPLSSQLIIKLPSLKSALKFTPSHSVKQSTSSQSAAKSTSSQSTVKSTLSQSTVKPLSSQPLSSHLIIKLPSSQSKLKFTPSHSVKQSTSSQSTVKSTSSQFTVKSTSSQSTVKPLSSQPLSSQLIIKLPSSQSKLKFTPSHSVKQSTSSQSTVKSTSSQSTVKSTSSQSTVKSTSSQSTVKSTSSQSTVKSTSSQSTVKSTSSQSTVQFTSSQCTLQSTRPQSTVKSTPSLFKVKLISSKSGKIIGDNVDNKKTNKNILHQNNFHKDEDTIPCPLCKLCFPSMVEMANHAAVHYVYKSMKDKYKCDICKKMFSWDYQLTMHQSTVHASEKHRKIKSTCSQCTLQSTRSTRSNSTVKSTPSLSKVKLISANSIAKLTPLHPIAKTIVPSQSTVKLTSSKS